MLLFSTSQKFLSFGKELNWKNLKFVVWEKVETLGLCG